MDPQESPKKPKDNSDETLDGSDSKSGERSPSETTDTPAVGGDTQSTTPSSAADSTIAHDPNATVGPQPTADGTADFSLDPNATQAFKTSPDSRPLPKSFSLQIPGYEILGELGRGAMGVVYSARQIRADRTVALKVMLNLDHANAEGIERFKVEAQAAAGLVHPNIVQVYDVNESAGCPYFTLEYVTGGTLSKKIEQQMLSAEESARLMITLAGAMQFAHSSAIVHRDLKPANIMLDANGDPKIADFGLARRLEDSSHLTQDGTVIGTPSYMAPEQTLGDPNLIKPAVDIYALGAILFELLTGRPPFKGASVWEVLRQVRTAEPMRPSELQPGVPLDLETICLKCLQKEPDKRYPSALALQQDLQRFINNEPILARPIGQWERLTRLCKRHPREAILVGTLAALLTIVAIGASLVAYRISQDRNQIATQSEKIEEQLVQIRQEKKLSDNRLSIYRDTVSSLVNRAPRLLENSPVGSNTKHELTKLLNQVLSQSPDNESVGSSKQWGLMATHLRQGETFLAEAQSIDSSQIDLRQPKLDEAEGQIAIAVEIAKGVYESEEPNRAKAASNYSIALARFAQVIYSNHPEKLNEAVPLFKQSIALAAEAVEKSQTMTTSSEGQSVDNALVFSTATVAEFRMKHADRLYQYSSFLMMVNPNAANYQTRSIEQITAARSLLREILKTPDLPAYLIDDTQNNLGLVCKLLAEIYHLKSDNENTTEAYEESLTNLQALVARAPYRPSFQFNMSMVAGDFGQHLLLTDGDPVRVRELYSIARQSLESLTRTNTIKMLEQSCLAIQWYALGLNAERQSDRAEAIRCFRMAASIHERAYREAEDDFVTKRVADNRQVVEKLATWTLCLARGKQRAEVLNNVRQVYVATLDKKPDATIADWLATSSASLGILAQHYEEGSSDRKTLTDNAIQMLEKAIAAGYRNWNYLRTDPDFSWLSSNLEQLNKIHALIQLAESQKEP